MGAGEPGGRAGGDRSRRREEIHRGQGVGAYARLSIRRRTGGVPRSADPRFHRDC